MVRFLPGTELSQITVRIRNTPVVTPPTAAGQIPISKLNTQTGKLEYVPGSNPFFNIAGAQQGDTPIIESVDSNGNVLFSYKKAVEESEITKVLFNQNGIYNPVNTTFTGSTLSVTGSFLCRTLYNGAYIDIVCARGDIVIAAVNISDVSIAKYITFIFVEVVDRNNARLAQTSEAPSSENQKERLYVMEVYHDGAGKINAVRKIYKSLNSIIMQQRYLANLIGLRLHVDNTSPRFTYSGASDSMSIELVIVGNNIREAGRDDDNAGNSVRISKPNASYTYLSYDKSLFVLSTTAFKKAYRIDNITNNTSSPLASNKFAIIVIVACISGDIFVLAPQKAYDSLQDAEVDRLNYVYTMKFPLNSDVFIPVATAIVNGSATDGIVSQVLPFFGAVKIHGSQTFQQRQLPDPATAADNSLVGIDPVAHTYKLIPNPIPDLSSVAPGSVLAVANGAVTTKVTGIPDPGVLKGAVGFDIVELIFDLGVLAVAKCSGDINKFDLGSVTVTVSGGTVIIRIPPANGVQLYVVAGVQVTVPGISIAEFTYTLIKDPNTNNTSIQIIGTTEKFDLTKNGIKVVVLFR